MASDSEAKYKGKFWKFIAIIFGAALFVLSIAFIIAIYIIVRGPPTLDDVQKAHEQELKSEGYKSESVTDDDPSKRKAETTFYDLLGVGHDANANEIMSSYLSKSKLLHPNHGNSLDDDAFIHLAEAYKTLSDTQKRMDYDHDLVTGKKMEKSTPMSMVEAHKLFIATLKKNIKSNMNKFIQRIRSIAGKIKSERQKHGSNFPMVGQIVKMLGGPRVRAFKISHAKAAKGGRMLVRVMKVCVGGICRITVARKFINPSDEKKDDDNHATNLL